MSGKYIQGNAFGIRYAQNTYTPRRMLMHGGGRGSIFPSVSSTTTTTVNITNGPTGFWGFMSGLVSGFTGGLGNMFGNFGGFGGGFGNMFGGSMLGGGSFGMGGMGMLGGCNSFGMLNGVSGNNGAGVTGDVKDQKQLADLKALYPWANIVSEGNGKFTATIGNDKKSAENLGEHLSYDEMCKALGSSVESQGSGAIGGKPPAAKNPALPNFDKSENSITFNGTEVAKDNYNGDVNEQGYPKEITINGKKYTTSMDNVYTTSENNTYKLVPDGDSGKFKLEKVEE